MADTISVVGNIATVPERRSTATGIPALSFRMATNHRRPDGNGGWVDASTNWFEVRAYRALAENAAVSLTKGDAVIVVGRLRLREWEGKEGRRGMSAEIEADSIGPDLRRGRGVFHRTIAAAPGAPADAGPPEPSAARDAERSDDGWATPGEDPTPF
jgi:single-strand DNA-binding protein